MKLIYLMSLKKRRLHTRLAAESTIINPWESAQGECTNMKYRLMLATCSVIVFLAACQSATTIPTLQITDSPLSTATSPPSPTSAPIKPINITAFCTIIGKDSKTYVPRGTPIIIVWGWSAKTETQINDFLQNNITTITLDGKVIDGILFDGIQKNESSGLPEVVWYSEVGVLTPGQHTITYDVKWKKMIDDGTSTYGPGSKNETGHDECQIIVE
jgi:hypothetical protein